MVKKKINKKKIRQKIATQNNDDIEETQVRLKHCFFVKEGTVARGGSRRVAKFLLESIIIAFDLIWKVWFSDINFATLLDPPLSGYFFLKNKRIL